jgi:hypothetical protein
MNNVCRIFLTDCLLILRKRHNPVVVPLRCCNRHVVSCILFVLLLLFVGCAPSQNDHSVGAATSTFNRISVLVEDSLFVLFEQGRICRRDIIALHKDSGDLIQVESKDPMLWIDERQYAAYEDSVRATIQADKKKVYEWVWRLPEMQEHLAFGHNRKGLYNVWTTVYTADSSGWYEVEVMRDYFFKCSPASPFGFLSVCPAKNRIIVHDPILGDLDLETWRASAQK